MSSKNASAKGAKVGRLDELGTDEQPQVKRQQEHLDEHQQRRGRQQPFLRPTGDAGEHDDVIHTRRQQHEQHPDEEHLVVRHDPRQQEHHDRDEDEVDDEDGGEESPVAECLPNLGERHAEEGGVEHQPEHGIGRRLRGMRNRRHQQTDRSAEHDRSKVQRNLISRHPLDTRWHGPMLPGGCRVLGGIPPAPRPPGGLEERGENVQPELREDGNNEVAHHHHECQPRPGRAPGRRESFPEYTLAGVSSGGEEEQGDGDGPHDEAPRAEGAEDVDALEYEPDGERERAGYADVEGDPEPTRELWRGPEGGAGAEDEGVPDESEVGA